MVINKAAQMEGDMVVGQGMLDQHVANAAKRVLGIYPGATDASCVFVCVINGSLKL